MPEQPPAIEENGGGQTADSQGDAEPLSLPIRIIEDPEEAQHARDREQQSDQHEAKDLDAQELAAESAERSATATERQVIPAWAQLIFAVLGTAALIWTLLLTRSAVKVSRDALIADHRPWVSVEPTLKSELRFKVRKGSITVWFRLKNHGRSPAMNVRLTTRFILTSTDTEIQEAIRSYMREHENWYKGIKPEYQNPLMAGATIFPDGYIIEKMELKIDTGGEKVIFPALIGSVAYLNPINPTRPHHTGFKFQLNTPHPDYPNTQDAIHTSDADSIPMEQLRLDRAFLSGHVT